MAEPDDFFDLLFRDLPPDRLMAWVGPLLGVARWEESPGFGWYGWDSRVGTVLVQVTPDADEGCTWVGVSFNSPDGPWPTNYEWASQAARELGREVTCVSNGRHFTVRPDT